METVTTIAELHQKLQQQNINSIGFVPTMGNLHAGHISLVEQAKKQHDCVVVSIYVNRKQFNQQQDFDNYPNTFDSDREKLTQAGASILFAPNENIMYPESIDKTTAVIESQLTQVLCGATRPGHFEGVTTIVAKFLNIIQPDSLYLGEKDYQQYLVIKKMVTDLFIPCQVEMVPTCREASGLAMSSRNNMLTESEREQSTHFRRPLALLKDALLKHPEQYSALMTQCQQEISQLGFKIDYLECRRDKDLTEYDGQQDIRQYRLFVAAFLGKARLIDNIRIV